jgi:beta-glucosidase
VLRGEWGFKGAVVSDYSAVDQLMSIHHIAPDLEGAAGALWMRAWMRICPRVCPMARWASRARRRVREAQVDKAVRRMLDLKFRAGLFENPYADARLPTKLTNDAQASPWRARRRNGRSPC